MTFLDAAYEILKQESRSLHYAEIAQRALDAGLLDTRGQTPEATMGSRLYVDTKKRDSRFRRTGRGIFALAEPRQPDVIQRIDDLNRQTRRELKKRLLALEPEKFEVLIGELLLAIGFVEETVTVTKRTSDGGIDVRGLMRVGGVAEVHTAVQAKRWKRNVQAPVVRNLRGSLKVHEHGIIITTSGYPRGAKAEAVEEGKTRISLVDGDMLIDLLVTHEIGVTKDQKTLIALDDEWWGEVAVEPKQTRPSQHRPADVDYPIEVRGLVSSREIRAQLLGPDGHISMSGQEYGSPSAAGKVATGWKAVNGWSFWKYKDPQTGQWQPIDGIREKS
jgi:restriction system protein